MSIDKNIKKLRRKLGLSQQQFAYEMEVSQEAISHYETGRRSPTIEIGCRMLKYAREHGIIIHLEDLLCNDWAGDI